MSLAAMPEELAAALAGTVPFVPRALAALVIGGAIAWRPWRRFMGLAPVKRDMAQAQVLLCVAGCLVVGIVGDSMARAFGLLGLGGLVRFRTALKDPRDAAVAFLLIGLGMAAGLGAWALVLGGGGFTVALMATLDRTWPVRTPAAALRLLVRCDRPLETESALRRELAGAGVSVHRSESDEMARTVEMVVEESTPGAMAAVLARAPAGVRATRCERVREKEE